MSVVVEEESVPEGNESVEQEPQAEEQEAQESSDIPERFREMSKEDVIKSYQEVEKALSRQGQEMGEIRKLADSLLQKELNSKPQEAPKEEVDFYEQPEKAVESVVEKKLKESLEPINQQMSESKRESFLNQLKSQYPDVEDVVKTPEFTQWVHKSKARLYLAQEADKHDLQSAQELLQMWEAEKGQTQQKETQEKRQKQLRDATTEKGSTGQGSKKIFRRQELLRMRMEDPDKYDSMQDEILRAYKEGRVR